MAYLRFRPLLSSVLAVALAACGGSGVGNNPGGDGGNHQKTDGGTNPTGGDSGGPFMEAAHPALPQVVSHGGMVLTAPNVVTIVWSGDPNASYFEQFAQWYVKSSTFLDAVSEYGVTGPGSDGGLHTLPEPPPTSITDSQIQSLLTMHIGDGVLPAPTPQTIYVFYLPKGAMESDGMGGTACVDYLGYHYVEFSSNLVYAVVVPCQTPGFSFADSETNTASHEISEASTDPFLDGYYTSYPDGGEVGDLCVGHTTFIADSSAPTGGWIVQREYSNKAAMSDMDPCLPATDPYYFNIAPGSGGVSLSAGGSTTLQLYPFSTVALGEPMTLYDGFDVAGLTATSDSMTYVNGQTGTLTISASSSVPPGNYVLFLEAYEGTSDWNGWDVGVHVN